MLFGNVVLNSLLVYYNRYKVFVVSLRIDITITRTYEFELHIVVTNTLVFKALAVCDYIF